MIANSLFKKTQTTLLIAIFLVTGCMMGPDFKRPVVQTPDRFMLAEKEAEETVNLAWWELFNASETRDCRTGSLNNSHHARSTVASTFESAN